MAGSIYVDFQKQPWFTATNQTRTLPYIYEQCKNAVLCGKMMYFTNFADESPCSAMPFSTALFSGGAYLMYELTTGGSQQYTVTSDNVMKRTR